ncbi:hypothetical protein IEQ34_021091 [Dendrobium chrysotoxum]|uniref:Uncharacterized protein n=1 Tax=Dendrobium chrysotoxum TaxID=161865 RepID=A0AAV7G374_DENCH|nr:hypothetical protein IEQ34_021091 [Dendrobium chrysotoxum]
MERCGTEIYAGEGAEEVKGLHGVSRVRVCKCSLLLAVHGSARTQRERERVPSDRKEGPVQKEISSSDTQASKAKFLCSL